jgi:transcriptional regulator GlxA family with amidase domain
MQWVMHCRMEKARERLQNPMPGDSVASVTRNLGFVNAASLARDFSRLIGVRPSSVLRRAHSSLDS